MSQIGNSLANKDWLKWSPEPFSGAIHNFDRPLSERLKSRQIGPYYMTPCKPGGTRGFYLASRALECDKHGSFFRLRLDYANDFLRDTRLSRIDGYYINEHQDETLTPIVARLPHRRGFLAGYTMGNGMISALDLYIYDTPEDAARAGHDFAERVAEQEREYYARQDHED